MFNPQNSFYIALLLGGFLYHFPVNYLYNRFKAALAELKGGGQSSGMGRRKVWLQREEAPGCAEFDPHPQGS